MFTICTIIGDHEPAFCKHWFVKLVAQYGTDEKRVKVIWIAVGNSFMQAKINELMKMI